MMNDIVEKLRDASSGHPDAVIPWPHRVLHEAADEIERLREEIKIIHRCYTWWAERPDDRCQGVVHEAIDDAYKSLGNEAGND